MHKLLATIKKEFLLLIRDKVGLSILFIMPMILIMVMTLIQDAAFKTLNEKGVPLVFVNNDQDSLGILIKQGLENNDLCDFSDSINGRPATAEMASIAVSEGKFLVGIIIPKGATSAIRNNVTQLVNETLNTDTAALNTTADSVEITILIDPATKKSVLSAITSNMHEFISEVKNRIIFQTFSEQIAEVIPNRSSAPKNAYQKTQLIRYKEVYASVTGDKIVPNAVQHNVPAWAIFAMFFIAIPLSGSIMKEQNEGSVFRLNTMPSSYLLLMNGKIIVCDRLHDPVPADAFCRIVYSPLIRIACIGHGQLDPWYFFTDHGYRICCDRLWRDGGHFIRHGTPGRHHGFAVHTFIVGFGRHMGSALYHARSDAPDQRFFTTQLVPRRILQFILKRRAGERCPLRCAEAHALLPGYHDHCFHH